jgi:hypothetical protein
MPLFDFAPGTSTGIRQRYQQKFLQNGKALSGIWGCDADHVTRAADYVIFRTEDAASKFV